MNPPCTSARGVYSLRLRRLPVITLLSALLAAPSGAGTDTRIVLATVGTATVAPGESITIRVSASGGPAPASAMLIGPELGMNIVERIPSDVVVAIPKRMRLGPSTIGAMAGSASGVGFLQSDLLEFDVERPDLPLRLHSQWSRPLSFDGPSSTGIPVMLSAIFADGASLEATSSTRVTYTSTDPSVAAVDPRSGVIETFAPGRATVEAVYRVGQQSVRFPFAVVVEVPMIEPSRYAVAFGKQKIGTSSAAQQVTLTNRHDAPVKILEIKTGGYFPQVNDCPPALEPGAACRVTVTFRPQEAGAAADVIEIVHGATLPYAIRVTGTGVK